MTPVLVAMELEGLYYIDSGNLNGITSSYVNELLIITESYDGIKINFLLLIKFSYLGINVINGIMTISFVCRKCAWLY